ncbi:hypothetical protein J6590_003389 [Homalodisca vitripennis]|nr:hypothetical protein J6590_003389 [Homalodisca vitripennis]
MCVVESPCTQKRASQNLCGDDSLLKGLGDFLQGRRKGVCEKRPLAVKDLGNYLGTNKRGITMKGDRTPTYDKLKEESQKAPGAMRGTLTHLKSTMQCDLVRPGSRQKLCSSERQLQGAHFCCWRAGPLLLCESRLHRKTLVFQPLARAIREECSCNTDGVVNGRVSPDVNHLSPASRPAAEPSQCY